MGVSTYVRYIKKYLLVALYNDPLPSTTIIRLWFLTTYTETESAGENNKLCITNRYAP